MSFTDPAVQPDAGQGGDPSGANAAPYQQYLDQIPEEHRGLVEPVLKKWDGDVTKRFQEAAQLRQQWEPFEQAGLHEYDPGSLMELVGFAQTLQDPEQFQGWLQQQAQQHGLLGPAPGSEVDDIYGDDPAFKAAVDAIVGPIQRELEDLRSWRQGQELTSLQDQAQTEIDEYLEALAGEHGDAFDKDAVEKFLPNYIGDLPIRGAIDRAYSDYKGLLAQIEQQFVNRKTGQPDPPVVPGATATQPAAVLSREEARAAATRMLRANNQA